MLAGPALNPLDRATDPWGLAVPAERGRRQQRGCQGTLQTPDHVSVGSGLQNAPRKTAAALCRLSPTPAASPGRLAGEPTLGVPCRLRCLLLQHGQCPAICHCPAPSGLGWRAGGGEYHLATHQHPGEHISEGPAEAGGHFQTHTSRGEKAVMEQFRHLPMPFHWKQEELKFNTILRRLQHRVGKPAFSAKPCSPGLRLAKCLFTTC